MILYKKIVERCYNKQIIIKCWPSLKSKWQQFSLVLSILAIHNSVEVWLVSILPLTSSFLNLFPVLLRLFHVLQLWSVWLSIHFFLLSGQVQILIHFFTFLLLCDQHIVVGKWLGRAKFKLRTRLFVFHDLRKSMNLSLLPAHQLWVNSNLLSLLLQPA